MTKAAGAEEDQWIRRFHSRPQARFRLVCMPHAGGVASSFLPISAALGAGTEVLGIQYPGRLDRLREPLIGSIDALAGELCRVLWPRTERPFALLGHSMGALTAFEVARRLEGAGRRPLRLFASGAVAPGRRRDQRMREADDPRLIAELRRLSGTDARVFGHEDLLRLMLPAIRNDYAAAETHVIPHDARLACPITVLIGDADPLVSLDDALAWSDYTRASTDVEVFPGGHFYLNQQRDQVAAVISARLAASSSGQATEY